ncbi:MAG TPA: acylneuraminate cytidylyltransferase family protein [Thermoanaerobaculia bacterium]|nr:acylneuraminate cytidylyltransferase family protein [Thermoanaerobaculia bacterium]
MSRRPGAVAIVLARGGSKGIPGKNLVRIAGRPLVAYTVAQALAVEEISRVIVSTDSAEIALAAKELGAEIVERPAELCGDTATSESGLLHCLDHLERTEGLVPELVVFLQPTSPLRSPRYIREAILAFEREGADSLFSAGPLQGLAWRMEEGVPVPVSYDPRSRKRRQDAPEYLAENGSIYVFKPRVLRDLNCRLGGKVAVYRMSALDSFEVDEPEDVPVVEFLLRSRFPELVCE